ncbi:hypothetical protein IPZ58_15705 [Streptomyces roseoverticillatus]|uniref:hypothetical protein n=1 Tax=Streptomyces roseoverticillatus TaxID=66429 RepID=UPI001F40B0E8|nr:hypothetical protein [Streptomyces roseoverticillatus]MCF3103022.1 hypothetical protein [Streptomyces roseoverticillatus]
MQEYEIPRHLIAHGFPAAELLERHLAEDASFSDVLLSAYLPDDGSDIDGFALGELLALHLSGVAETALVHLDVRCADIRRSEGRANALLDWSNALLGDATLAFG